MSNRLENKRILVTGGTGSLGRVLVRRILDGELGIPRSLTIFSRDEAKQHYTRIMFENHEHADKLEFRLGDIGEYHDVVAALRDIDIVAHCSAMKQVVPAEFFPLVAIRTNIIGASNIVKALTDLALPIERCVFISTDKSCLPSNSYGATKFLQERIFTAANLDCDTDCVGVRYGNVAGSTGSVLPLWADQIRNGGPVTLTTTDMSRFLMSIETAVDTIFTALIEANPGEIYVPQIPSAMMTDVASVLIGDRDIATTVTGIRPGEKIAELLISADEATRSVRRGDYYAIMPTIPALQVEKISGPIIHEYSSADNVLDRAGVAEFLTKNNLLLN